MRLKAISRRITNSQSDEAGVIGALLGSDFLSDEPVAELDGEFF